MNAIRNPPLMLWLYWEIKFVDLIDTVSTFNIHIWTYSFWALMQMIKITKGKKQEIRKQNCVRFNPFGIWNVRSMGKLKYNQASEEKEKEREKGARAVEHNRKENTPH